MSKYKVSRDDEYSLFTYSNLERSKAIMSDIDKEGLVLKMENSVCILEGVFGFDSDIIDYLTSNGYILEAIN